MSAWGRIHQDLNDHPKFQKISLAALGLWTRGNAWTRKHRSAGYIPLETAVDLAGGEEDLVWELVAVSLWDEDHLGGFMYHDYLEHNGDTKPRTMAGRLVEEIIPLEHPSLVRQQLAAKVSELLEDGAEIPILTTALKLWLAKPHAGVSLLPHLYSDAVRTAQGGIDAVLRTAWKTGDLTPLAAKGYTFVCPDIPSDLNVAQTRAFAKKAKRDWLTKLREELQ